MPAARLTAPDMTLAKGRRKLVMVTAYDFTSAALAEKAGVDMILVGDSLAMVVLGHEDTLAVTMEEMLHHVRAAAAGTTRALLVADLPFLSYQASAPEAVTNAGRLLKEGRARAVKLEGGSAYVPHIRAMVAGGIPVLGHIGLTPQFLAVLGGFKVQAKTAEAAKFLLDEALALEAAGCFGVLLEAVPAEVAEVVTQALSIPTIGIGAGPGCDGQVLVFHDILGLYDRLKPKFVKRYAEAGTLIVEALTRYADDVTSGAFPGPEHAFSMAGEEFRRFEALSGPARANSALPLKEKSDT